jgi:hypothetical protein
MTRANYTSKQLRFTWLSLRHEISLTVHEVQKRAILQGVEINVNRRAIKNNGVRYSQRDGRGTASYR